MKTTEDLNARLREITDHNNAMLVRQAEWNTRMPSRGLGDTVAKFTHKSGLAYVVEAFVGHPCGGCGKRQDTLNKIVPYQSKRE